MGSVQNCLFPSFVNWLGDYFCDCKCYGDEDEILWTANIVMMSGAWSTVLGFNSFYK